MSDPVPTPTQTPAPAPSKKTRSPAERAVVWGGIAILLGVLAFEAFQKFSYEPTVARLRGALSEQSEKDMRLSQIRQMIAGSPGEVQTPHERRVYNRIDLKWPSLFKDYRVQLIVEREGDDPLVVGFSTPGGTDPEVPDQSAESVATAVGSRPTPPMIATPPMIGPGVGVLTPSAPNQPGTFGAAIPPMTMGGRGGPGGGPRGLFGIAQREEVIEELKLTEGQSIRLSQLQIAARMSFQSLMVIPENERVVAMQKMRNEQEKLVGEVLNQQQRSRLLQLVWRETGLLAVERDDVAQKLGLSDNQRAKLRPIMTERLAAQRELRGATPEVIAQKRKDWEDRVRVILTEEQIQQWEELLGPPAPEPVKLGPTAS